MSNISILNFCSSREEGQNALEMIDVYEEIIYNGVVQEVHAQYGPLCGMKDSIAQKVGW